MRLPIAAAAVASPPAHAQDTYPSHDVEIIVPFVAGGGGTDLIARMLVIRRANILLD
jgi:tripartite-type tricarboxylate transporter receptor subunit TctC